ncbi:metallophosphoesterase family protein [Dictyobacter aurantiacus]|uniref:DeoR family transcriptional regulator n=1 Tax=Dictyobacter aurantiacus TaxID=1936993 RepID=A0A401ZJU4_9CHLR|nr:metallophosphoesterase family protein [Dictyobacter aurantiacus]GCE07098.1 DeoR family transcriptional regulator [Dictyobacter aurantiacus]
MKIAALYDIHGNLPALNAVLSELEEVRSDLIVVGGDIVSGPMPSQTLERLVALGDRVRFIRGNGDREVVMIFDGQPLPPAMSEEVRVITSWVAGQFTRSQRDFLAALPERITLSISGLGDILFCHATPRNDEEIFTTNSPRERLATIFAGVQTPIVVCGHTHVQFEIPFEGLRIINSGSVGMPYADQPGAYWLLLDEQGPHFRRTPYDLQAAAQAIEASGYPQAHEFATENVLTVPTAAEAMEIFERLAHD